MPDPQDYSGFPKAKPLAAFVLWVGVSRVSVGAHFPADILAAWFSSGLIVLLVRAAVNRALQLKSQNERAVSSRE